jgi:hypothetical protein
MIEQSDSGRVECVAGQPQALKTVARTGRLIGQSFGDCMHSVAFETIVGQVERLKCAVALQQRLQVLNIRTLQLIAAQVQLANRQVLLQSGRYKLNEQRRKEKRLMARNDALNEEM